MIEDNCFNKYANANGGDLCNGYRLKGAAQPIYIVNNQYVTSWTNPQRLTPLPPRPTM
jgi:hypothetical protein